MNKKFPKLQKMWIVTDSELWVSITMLDPDKIPKAEVINFLGKDFNNAFWSGISCSLTFLVFQEITPDKNEWSIGTRTGRFLKTWKNMDSSKKLSLADFFRHFIFHKNIYNLEVVTIFFFNFHPWTWECKCCLSPIDMQEYGKMDGMDAQHCQSILPLIVLQGIK